MKKRWSKCMEKLNLAVKMKFTLMNIKDITVI